MKKQKSKQQEEFENKDEEMDIEDNEEEFTAVDEDSQEKSIQIPSEIKVKIQELCEQYKEEDFEKLKTTQQWEMGIDEAGRGPVLGPMVYGCCLWPISAKDQLKKLGFADSKQLKEFERDYLFEVIKQLKNKCLFYIVDVIHPETISNKMLLKNKISLNDISFNSAFGLIESAENQNFNLAQVYLDTVGPANKYEEKLYNRYQIVYPKLKFTVAEKADSKYPVVSAASICAKVTRDTEVKQWNFKQNLNSINKKFGSGYPGDPVTKKWLNEHGLDKVFGYPDIVRFSWGTITKLLQDKVVKFDFPAEEVIEIEDNNQQSINAYFRPTKQTQQGYLMNHINFKNQVEL